MDGSLRNRAREVFEKDQKQLDGAFEPSSDVKAVGIVSSITITENADRTYTKTVKEEKAEDLYFDDSVVGKVENQIKEDAETLQAFCKQFDDEIITLNAQINEKKQLLVTLSTEAIARNCSPGIAYSTDSVGSTIIQSNVALQSNTIQGNDYSMFGDRVAMEIYKPMAGPDVNYGAENPFDPTSIVTLTSANSGFGHENNRDNGRLNAGDAATEVEADDYNVGGGGDGSKEYLTNFESSTNLGTVRSDISQTPSVHTAPVSSTVTIDGVQYGRYYPGAGVAPPATDTSTPPGGVTVGQRCVAIGASITTIISEILTLRTQRDAAVSISNLNKVKEKKMEKELQNWGAENVRKKQTQRKTSNADVISAMDNISDDADGIPAIINDASLKLYYDAKSGNSSGLWLDISGNGNHGTITNANYVSTSPQFFNFNGENTSVATSGGIDLYDTSTGTEISVEAWVNADTFTSDDGDTKQRILGGEGTGLHYDLAFDQGKARGRVGGSAAYAFSGTLNTGQWYHLVFTYTSQRYVRIYVDASEAGIYDWGSGLGPTISKNGTVKLGEYSSANSFNLNGKIGETRVYNRALSPTEITQNYNATKARYE